MTIPFQAFMTDAESTRYNSASEALAHPATYLEQGGILYFEHSPFGFSDEDRDFLLNQKQLESPRHKNIAYKPHLDKLTGIDQRAGVDTLRLKAVLKSYSEKTTQFLDEFLSPYRNHRSLDYTSFRPLEEEGRVLRLRARNDLLHVDSFPTRPTYGKRILRVFTNIHPTKVRVWKTSDNFEVLAHRFKGQMRPLSGQLERSDKTSLRQRLSHALGLKQSNQSPYDRWMMDFHNFLKENADFQAQARKATWEFPPHSGWMVYTDMVSHSVLSGQYALEQTFLIDPEAQLLPEKAPIEILKDLYGYPTSTLRTAEHQLPEQIPV